MSTETDKIKSNGSQAESLIKAKMFYAQRNLYLTGSVLFLTLILNRFHSMLVDVFKAEEKMNVLVKQAENTSNEYMKLLDRDTSVNAEIKELKAKLNASEAKVRDSETLLKQAKQQSDEYMRLADQYNALEKKMMGSTEGKKDL